MESNTYPSTVPTLPYCLSSLEFPREAFSGLFYSYSSSMTFLSMYCTPYHYCSQTTPNVCPPYHLLLTVNIYNLISTSSPTGVLSGSCSSMSPNAHCCPSVQTIIAVPTSFPTTSTITKSLHVLITRILASLCLTISPGLSILLKSLPKHKNYRILGLLRRTFSATNSITTRKSLYISLVRSQLLYGSQIWRPVLIKDIKSLEQIQRRATKFILNGHYTGYRSRLLKLHLLPLMMTLELQDILFFVRSLKQSALNCSSFNISQYTSFSSNATRSGSHSKLVQPFVKTNRFKNFYFNRFPHLWNALPPIDLQLSYESIKIKLTNLFWNSFVQNFDSNNPCSYHFCCPCSKCSLLPKSTFLQ